MSDKEILDKYVGLEKFCLSDLKKKQVMDMIYKYKDAFTLRDEIGACPNIEGEIDVTDKSPFSIWPYHVSAEGKKYWTMKWRRLCYLGILKEGFQHIQVKSC